MPVQAATLEVAYPGARGKVTATAESACFPGADLGKIPFPAMIRSAAYWTIAVATALLAMGAAAKDRMAEAEVDWMASPENLVHVMPVPEPARAAFLGIGIMAVAFTYRRAWLNMKRKAES